MATLTVSSLGERGVDAVYGIIHPPQVAPVGVGRIVVRAGVVEDRVEPRPVIALTLSADHRASGGHSGGRFLEAVARRLAEPESL